MKAALTDLAAMAQETRERALRHAMALELAEKAGYGDLWDTAAGLAMDAEGAAAMTITSILKKTCARFRGEHDECGYIDIEEDSPGLALLNHECEHCAPLQLVARSLTDLLGELLIPSDNDAGTDDSGLDRTRDLHLSLLGQVHVAAAAAIATPR